MKHVGILLMALLGMGQCFAEVQSTALKEEKGKIKKQVETAFPELVIDSVEKSPISGLYQLTSGPLVFYTSNDGRYVLSGDVLDILQTDEKKNITEEARRDARVGVFKGINVKDMIVYRPKEVKGVVTVFTDADCAYCKKLHSEISKLLDLGIEVRYLAYPRQGVGSATYTKMETVWCSKDRQAVMEKVMNGESVTPKTCQNTIEDQMTLGVKLGIRGTPTIVFEDGTIHGGYLVADKLAQETMKHGLGG